MHNKLHSGKPTRWRSSFSTVQGVRHKSICNQRSVLKEEQLIVNMFRDSPWPGNILSNFADTPFVFDRVHCACSESFIQSLKISDTLLQENFCALQGEEAWKEGSKLTEAIFASGNVWWKGSAISLHSDEHFKLVRRGPKYRTKTSTTPETPLAGMSH